jgi:16S rRNA (guanine527-N7)-methyltransferase
MDAAALITARSARAGVEVAAPMVAQLAQYIELLARWNRRINLTALAVDPPDDAAIDRLIVEPLVAAKLLTAGDRLVMDIGSGGGSPAIPMKIAAPQCRFLLVESKDRKSAFLREAVRQTALTGTDVLTSRVEDLVAPAPGAAVDVITLRAVRLDDAMAATIRRQMVPGGRLLWFQSTEADRTSMPRALEIIGTHDLLPGTPSRVAVARIATSGC